MIFKWLKRGTIVTVGLLLVGGLVFGKDVVSYVSSSVRSARTAIKDSVPTEFELQRARDLLEGIIPEMHANIRIIAEEEVEISSLSEEIPKSRRRLGQQRAKIEKFSNMLSVERVSYELGGQQYTHREITEELARRFDRFREAEIVLASKQRLLQARQKSLRGAKQILERTRGQKASLEEQISALEAQHRLVRAASVGSQQIRMDNTKLAQAEKLIGQIRKRLDVAERVLAHEARLTEPIPMETTSAKDLVAQVKEHLSSEAEKPAIAPATDLSKTSGGRQAQKQPRQG